MPWRQTQAGTLPPRADATAAGDIGAAWAACMRRHDFAGAWAIGDAILAQRDRAARDDPRLPYHLRWVWDGTPPDGRHVVVRCYHGLGDTLQFARFLPALGRRAAHVTLEAQPELCALLAELPGVDRLVPFDTAAPLPPGACDIEIMEVAHALRATAADAAACVPYLRVPPARIAAVSGVANAIGLCWAAGGWDASRSVPLAALMQACGAEKRLTSLQRGPSAAEAQGGRFTNPGDTDMDVTRTAALAAASPIVVSVDSMVAHLAGALGKPVFLLAKRDPDWRWPLPGQKSAWYPATTVLHQHRLGDWSGALEALRQALAASVAT